MSVVWRAGDYGIPQVVQIDRIVLTFKFLCPGDQWELRSVWLPAALIRHNTATNTYPCIQGVGGDSDP